ncbi:MAG: UrcA family protein [Erythrobacter sp.]|jgi:UrcA family protein
MKSTLALIVAAGAAGLAAPAAAIPANAEPYSMRVKYSDLNLATPEGLAHLERRIDNAARKVCGFERSVTGTRLRSPQVDACRENAKAKAMAHVAAVIKERTRGG